MKKILFPFVIENNNKAAFIYAAKIARRLKAELILFNTYKIPNKRELTKSDYKNTIRDNWQNVIDEVNVNV